MDGVTREKRKRHTIRRQEEHIMSAERRGPTVVLQKELIRGETKRLHLIVMYPLHPPTNVIDNNNRCIGKAAQPVP